MPPSCVSVTAIVVVAVLDEVVHERAAHLQAIGTCDRVVIRWWRPASQARRTRVAQAKMGEIGGVMGERTRVVHAEVGAIGRASRPLSTAVRRPTSEASIWASREAPSAIGWRASGTRTTIRRRPGGDQEAVEGGLVYYWLAHSGSQRRRSSMRRWRARCVSGHHRQSVSSSVALTEEEVSEEAGDGEGAEAEQRQQQRHVAREA